MRVFLSLCLVCLSTPAFALAPPCNSGTVYEDRNGNGQRDAGEHGLAGIRVSDGQHIVSTDAQGAYHLGVDGVRSSFVIKPAGYRAALRPDGLPDTWRTIQYQTPPTLRFGGVPQAFPMCRDYGLQRERKPAKAMDVLLFGDPQPKSTIDVGYYERDIVAPLVGHTPARLGLTMGDLVNDDLSLYPALKAVDAKLGLPWLHTPGNHDLDFDAVRDEDSLQSFRQAFGPDTYAWEEPQANFIVLDDVIYRPGQKPAYVGGLREDQFAFLEAYLAGADPGRLLVISVHIPFFDDAAPGVETFRRADRTRLFGLLRKFPRVLLLSAHTHAQKHYFHGPENGWLGAQPLHEFNVGAACGAYWSGVKDADGIPSATMADGTPNGYAVLSLTAKDYRLRWFPARGPESAQIGLHAPKVLRRGAYPAYGVFANYYMGDAQSRVEYRIDEGEWKPMVRVVQADPAMLAENIADDLAPGLRGFDRSPEAEASVHLWRGALPTTLAAGEHRIEVRAFDRWRGEVRASSSYRLDETGAGAGNR
ncbi:calcineurin-like phosphoesterase C-terminal domain-containing protein [Arenimonas oryziterrae]|uniref:Calcineurin phosphoesterase n=1 Tax=Arenimonas oryziterrae DSM 21050 = YC6267 TaxID=1121015 RepID=A0A091APM7_9GAMM|nr:calcineurin-like phosphoesterase C-terminal domain-containing protein [Arenimonas oryziterrae]KFN41087.1 hypothetical protein N789_04160 [Arenimonas oryziterrae DSM 21050 = YC6267]